MRQRTVLVVFGSGGRDEAAEIVVVGEGGAEFGGEFGGRLEAALPLGAGVEEAPEIPRCLFVPRHIRQKSLNGIGHRHTLRLHDAEHFLHGQRSVVGRVTLVAQSQVGGQQGGRVFQILIEQVVEQNAFQNTL